MNKNFNAEYEVTKLVEWIQKYVQDQPSIKKIILGISGGKDSTFVANLVVKALGKDMLYGVLMPNGVQKDLGDSIRVVTSLGIEHSIVDISKAFLPLVDTIQNEMFSNVEITPESMTNIAPRLRMTTLYAIAQSKNGRVIGTGNANEGYVGYTTKHGDCACDFNPIAEYTVAEIIAMGDFLGIDYDLMHKAPNDGLGTQTDEEKLGFTYAQLDQYVEMGTCGDKEIDMKISWKHMQSLHKFNKTPQYARN